MTWKPPTKSTGVIPLAKNTILGFGDPKIGKTTFFSKFPDALFLLTEEGADHVQINGISIQNWEHFVEQIDGIEGAMKKREFTFKTIVIDTADELSIMCKEYICNKYALGVLGDGSYGDAYDRHITEFRHQVRRLAKMNIGLAFVSHTIEKSKTENDKPKIMPSLDKRPYLYLESLVDMILYFGVDEKDQRIIITQPTSRVEAGDRSGRLPKILPLNYDVFVKAYGIDPEPEDGPTESHDFHELVTETVKIEEWMSTKRVDGFDVPKRVNNARVKHLGAIIIASADPHKLKAYNDYLKQKVNNFTEMEKGEKKK